MLQKLKVMEGETREQDEEKEIAWRQGSLGTRCQAWPSQDLQEETETLGEDPWDLPGSLRTITEGIILQQQPTASPKGRILEIIASWSGVTAPACDTAAENIDKAPAPLGGT